MLDYADVLFIAVLTLLLGAIPAALYERLRGLKESTPVSLGIWLVATGLIALPSLASLARPLVNARHLRFKCSRAGSALQSPPLSRRDRRIIL